MRRLIGVVTQSIRSSGLSPGASRGWRSSVTWTKKPRPLLLPVAIGAGDRLLGLHRGDAGRCFSALAKAIVTDSDSYAPITPPVSQEDLEKLVNFLAEHENVLVIAGAGCSTESGVPDYRGPRGAYTTDNYKPMTHQKFMANDTNRSRYWARSFAGWMDYAQKKANGAHIGLHRLRSRNWVSNIITQNVDRLQHSCGTPDVLEIHGTNHETRCTTCQWATSRMHVQQMLNELNPGLEEQLRAAAQSDITQTLHGAAPDPEQVTSRLRPDGDVDLGGASQGFRFPPCPQCGGILKPDVVYFGASVPKHKVLLAELMAKECDALLLLGTSCSTLSCFRLVQAVHERGAAVAAVNVGPTRADPLLSFTVEARVGEVLMRLATHDSLLLERPAKQLAKRSAGARPGTGRTRGAGGDQALNAL